MVVEEKVPGEGCVFGLERLMADTAGSREMTLD
jgi:hypothetical protein